MYLLDFGERIVVDILLLLLVVDVVFVSIFVNSSVFSKRLVKGLALPVFCFVLQIYNYLVR